MDKICIQNSSSLFPIETQCLRVLLIDHDADFSSYMKRMLEQYSFIVTVVDTTAAGLCMINSKRFMCDLVIIELDMPEMDGLKFMKIIMKFRRELPIILISGRGDEILAKKAFDEGACFFLHKPINDQDILNVRRHVFRYRSSGKYTCKIMVNNFTRAKWYHEYKASIIKNWATPHSSASTISSVKEIVTHHQQMPSQLQDKNNDTILNHLQPPTLKRVKSTNQIGNGFFYQIIHDMKLKINNRQFMEKTLGKIQEDSFWNLLVVESYKVDDNSRKNMPIPKDPNSGSSMNVHLYLFSHIEEWIKNSPPMNNNPSSLLENDGNKGNKVHAENHNQLGALPQQTLTYYGKDKSEDISHENFIKDTCLIGKEQDPQDSSKLIGQNQIHDDGSQGLLFDYGYSNNNGENYQSNMHPQGEASSSYMVDQFDGKSQNNNLSNTFGRRENDTYENFIDYQYEAQIESFYKSWESPPNKDII